MTISETFLPEFDQEMAITRRVLERVPTDKGPWKPHDKSFPIGHLAQLLARMPGWITNVVQQRRLDLSAGGTYTFERTEDLLEVFDRNVREARAALQAAKDEDFSVNWALTLGPQTINHLVHHRGQMTVYLRLLDIKVPSVYGPTADEGWGG